MRGLAGRWNGLSPRERWMIAALGLLIAGAAAWYGVWRPLASLRQSAADRVETAAVRLAQARAAADLVQSIPDWGANIEAEVRSSAAAAHITLAPRAPGMQIDWTFHVDGADPAAFFAWAKQLHDQHGVSVIHFTGTAETDGRVDIDTVLWRGIGSPPSPR